MLPYDPGGGDLIAYLLLPTAELWVFDHGGSDSEFLCRISWMITLWPFDLGGLAHAGGCTGLEGVDIMMLGVHLLKNLQKREFSSASIGS